jgi:hypothetical protein
MSLPVFIFKSMDTWEGAYTDYGGWRGFIFLIRSLILMAFIAVPRNSGTARQVTG